MADANIPEFGQLEPGVDYELRPGGYVVIANHEREIAVVRAPGGLYLPGGKQEPGETLEEAAVRETAEECGLQIEIGDYVGIADELVYADTEDRYYRKRETFFTAVVVGTTPARELDHELLWMPVQQAAQSLLHHSQRWAVVKAYATETSGTGESQVTEEYFDVVDEQDRVLGRAPRSVVHRHHLLHRAAHIFLFNPRGELLVQLRSEWKDEYPLCYTSSASGHLGAGESYDEAAPRELEEELGVRAPLQRLAKFPASPQTAYEHTVLYEAHSAEQPRFDPQEVAGVSFHPLAEIAKMLRDAPQRFSPPFVVLLEWYLTKFRRAV